MSFKKVAGLCMLGLCVIFLGCIAYDAYVPNNQPLKIYGSVDVRTVRLAFEEAGRIASVEKQEGDVVRFGEVVARLDDSRYQVALEQAQAQVQVSQKQLDLLLAGARQEDIQAAKASLEAARVQSQLSERNCQREKSLAQASSLLRIDQACSQAQADQAQQQVYAQQLAVLQAGARIEEIEVARAQLELSIALRRDAERALKNCQLTAPADGVVRARYLEAGDMAGAALPVYEIALMDPLWVRAWVDAVNLARLHMGQRVQVYVDSYPNQAFTGQVGFISTVAEFTPKTVQTEALRTSLVYEVRISLEDPQRLLRMGMPVTVQIPQTDAQGM